jgi:selenium-dependent xanthine dehydrogenase
MNKEIWYDHAEEKCPFAGTLFFDESEWAMSTFYVNGNSVTTEKNQKLLDYLRETLNLTSVKNGCGEGACGTCMVLLDGVATKACVLRTNRLEGRSVVTVEGLSAREKEVYAYSFSKAGAVQCGFCTPGMVISAKGLLDKNPMPSAEHVRQAIKNNICRCTGYKKIEDAILLAASLFQTGEKIPEEREHGDVGERLNRIDSASKTLGAAEYVDDMRLPGLVYGSAVRTKYSRARVVTIDAKRALALPGVLAVLTAADIPGSRIIGHIKKDWDVMIPVGGITRYLGDAVALVAAETKDILEEAKALIDIVYEELPGCFTPEESLEDNAPSIHEDGNVLSVQHVHRGDPDLAIKNSRYVVTNHYSTPFTEHAFLETETAVGLTEEDGTVVVYCGDQGIYQTRTECALMLGLDPEKVRVIAKMVGGAFGGKEDMSVQHHAALLAYHLRRPVKVALTRSESLTVHPKRHAFEMDVTTACDENGYLTAMKAVLVSDTGAYASLGVPVIQRACTHGAGPYNYQNVDIVGKAVYTNNPPAGAYRGFGVTQSCFAGECNLNQLAELAGISPWEIRYRNAIRPGQVLPNGQIADGSTALAETLEAIRDRYENNPKMGIACCLKNSGLGVGIPDIGRCRLVVLDGKVRIRTSAACIGQGLGTILIQMVHTVTGVDLDDVAYDVPDTAIAPNSGNTTASRQTLFTGEAAHIAALALKDALSGATLGALNGREFYGEYLGVTDKFGADVQYPISHITYSYATHLIELDGDGRLKTVTAVHDVGRAINPKNIEGQIEGGVVMSLGYALTEDFPVVKGKPSAKYGTLGLFKASDVPEIDIVIIEKSDSDLALGAKGIGEISAIPTAPAVQLAYYNFDGKFRTSLPLEDTPYSRKNR